MLGPEVGVGCSIRSLSLGHPGWTPRSLAGEDEGGAHPKKLLPPLGERRHSAERRRLRTKLELLSLGAAFKAPSHTRAERS